MSYPQGAPAGPGYPPAQQPNAQFGAPTQQFAKLPDADGARMNKLPAFLGASIAAIGLLVYLASFGPQFTARSEIGTFIEQIRRKPQVMDVYFLAGADDFILHVAARDTDDLRSFVVENLNADAHVASTQTSLIFEHLRGASAL